MIPEFQHKIAEQLVLVREVNTAVTLMIMRISDGYFFNTSTQAFDSSYVAGTNDSTYTYNMSALYSTGLATLSLTVLPEEAQDLLFIYTDNSVTTWERHVFGGASTTTSPSLCRVYGTLKDVSGRPLVGEKVEAYLNRAGFFVHKAGLIGYASTTLTDQTGYFELPLITGLDVTINVPIIGFTQRGFVPNVAQVELTTQALLSYQP